MPPFIVCEPRSTVRLSINWSVLTPRALYVKFVFGVAGLINANGNVGSGCGVAKVKKYLLMPTIASFVIVAVGDQRQFTAKFFGVRDVSTKLGDPGKIGRPPFAESPKLLWLPWA